MNRTYQKNILRTLASSRGRFLSIFSIVALGVGFLAGLVSSTPNMRLSVETYLDSADFYDLRVLGTLGLTDDDVQALAAVEGVESVRPAYSADLLVDTREADSVVARVHSLPEGGDGAQGACVNRLQLTEGRWPQSSGECVVETGAGDLARGLEIGDVITVPAEDNEDLGDKLAVTQFTVVGAVHDATYFSFEREPASVGSGAVQTIFYILPQDFSYEAYTEIYLTAAGAKELDSLDTAYEDTVQAVSDAVEGISGARCEARYTQRSTVAQKEIDDAWDEYNEAAEEAQTELADAAKELADGREALADGAQELADGEREKKKKKYQDGLAELADYEQQLADGEEALNAGEAELIEGQAEWDSGWQQIVDGEKQLSDAKKQLDDAQAQYDQGAAAYADALAQLEAGEKELEDGRALLEQSQKQYEDGLAQWEQGKEQMDQLRQLQQGEAAYYDGIRQLAEQLQQAGLPVTEEQIQELIAELAAQNEEMPTEEEFLQMVLDWLLDREQGQEDAAVAAVRQALAALRAAQEAAQPSTPETAALDMAPLAEIDAAADEGAASELWQQILDELRGMEDEVPEEMRPYYEELLEAIEQLPQRPDLTDPVRQLYEGVRQLVEARRQLDAGIQAIIDTYAEMGETLTPGNRRGRSTPKKAWPRCRSSSTKPRLIWTMARRSWTPAGPNMKPGPPSSPRAGVCWKKTPRCCRAPRNSWTPAGASTRSRGLPSMKAATSCLTPKRRWMKAGPRWLTASSNWPTPAPRSRTPAPRWPMPVPNWRMPAAPLRKRRRNCATARSNMRTPKPRSSRSWPTPVPRSRTPKRSLPTLRPANGMSGTAAATSALPPSIPTPASWRRWPRYSRCSSSWWRRSSFPPP